MKFREFESHVRDLPAFNLNDVRKFDPGFHRQQLNYWLNKELIKPLAGGYYRMADQEIDEGRLFMFANRIYEPSYISLESALAYYQVIPETVLGVTSVSSRKTKSFESAFGSFKYRSVKSTYMFGYRVVEVGQNVKYKIARLEKAILDYLYLQSDVNVREDYEGLRWNKRKLQHLDGHPVFSKYLNIFGTQALENRVAHLMEYIYA